MRTFIEFQALILHGTLVFLGPHYHGLFRLVVLVVDVDLTMSCGINVLISVFDVPGTLFHISVNAIAAGSKEFRSSFYVLFCVITMLDVFQMFQVVSYLSLSFAL